ncbi:DeoR/GlpR family DNA-binding transcription regulator [Anaeromassilibacillus senegalensis]|uniref:DeoR/GlpR family DNA-binding transcription regulator n=1 Tax=Anaeromassilibacillus senegalensis TaxID=1673717 RepID=UPI0006818A69|nr:DeoR/GlpR family DNA-binding transcription regulator [Anaeromassilibacillus senegalensis]
MRSQRIQQIEAYINEHKTVTLDQICESFQVSKSTIRRDLDEILADSRYKKIYGGITVQTQKAQASFDERNIAQLGEKKRIAALAAEQVRDGDIIFIDSGTTTLHMIETLSKRDNLTILTNHLEIIYRAIPYPNINVIALSGQLNRKTLSFTDAGSVQELKNYNISKAFLSTSGLSIASGVTNSSPMESEIKRMAVQRSRQVFLLADHTKYNTASLVTYCGLEQIHVLVTDARPPVDIIQFLEDHQISILTAEE